MPPACHLLSKQSGGPDCSAGAILRQVVYTGEMWMKGAAGVLLWQLTCIGRNWVAADHYMWVPSGACWSSWWGVRAPPQQDNDEGWRTMLHSSSSSSAGRTWLSNVHMDTGSTCAIHSLTSWSKGVPSCPPRHFRGLQSENCWFIWHGVLRPWERTPHLLKISYMFIFTEMSERQSGYLASTTAIHFKCT